MFKMFLNKNKGWLCFLTAMLLTMGVVYKAQSEEVKNSIQTDSQTLEEVVEPPSERAGFIEWVGGAYRTVITKTSNGYESFTENVKEYRINRYTQSMYNVGLMPGEKYLLKEKNTSDSLQVMFMPDPDYQHFYFKDNSDNLYAFTLTGTDVSGIFESQDVFNPNFRPSETESISLKPQEDLLDDDVGKDVPILSQSGNN